jgi:predicted DsbA family dithiol-disulfide isomerase
MGERLLCCRDEPSLDELLAEDEVMMPVLRSAGLDRNEFRELLLETARRREDRARADARRARFRPG